MRPELRQRLGSAALFLPLVVALVWLHPWTYAALLAVAAVVGGWELGLLLSAMGLVAPAAVTAAAALLILALGLWAGTTAGVMLLTATALAGAFAWLFKPRVPASPPPRALAWAAHLGGALYLGLLLACWGRLEAGPWASAPGTPEGSGRAFWAILIVWATDTGAYVAGTRAGRHKMWPAVSPAKTWEGGIGGLLAGILLGVLLAPRLVPGLSPGGAAAVAGLAAIAAELGDLLESRLKRRAGVKDSGRFMPGHGGMLDRLDSLLPAGPVFAWGLAWLLG